MAVLDLITKEVIKTPLESSTKMEVLEELVKILADSGKITDPDTVLSAVLSREDMGSTGLEGGVAVPHAKTDSVSSLLLAVGIAPNGIDFDSMDGDPSKIFFLILAPPDQSGPHIQALSEIAKLTQSKAFCRLLVASEDPQEVLELFHED